MYRVSSKIKWFLTNRSLQGHLTATEFMKVHINMFHKKLCWALPEREEIEYINFNSESKELTDVPRVCQNPRPRGGYSCGAPFIAVGAPFVAGEHFSQLPFQLPPLPPWL
eukprot:GFUD01039028.1.p1 GENE.GFUD01039028.1~~GFUD01039028.1.p1  ORF type:complete len:110 (-),score=5.01 GFUD01039028.1:593-922(-)